MRVTFQCVGVSAVTGEGVKDFWNAVQEAAQEYKTVYKPEMEKRIAEKVPRSLIYSRSEETKRGCSST